MLRNMLRENNALASAFRRSTCEAVSSAQLTGAVSGLALWFAKTLADFEINDLAALPPLFCYNS